MSETKVTFLKALAIAGVIVVVGWGVLIVNNQSDPVQPIRQMFENKPEQLYTITLPATTGTSMARQYQHCTILKKGPNQITFIAGGIHQGKTIEHSGSYTAEVEP